MYSISKTETLVTIATHFSSNLALKFEDDFFNADGFCVAHDGHINYIPLKNQNKKCKYVPVSRDHLGTGKIKEIKWVKIEFEIYFITLSDLGLHIFDEELANIKFVYSFDDFTLDNSCPNGCCVSKDILYVAVDNSKIFAFQCKRNYFQIMNETNCIFSSFGGSFKSYIVTDHFDAVSLWKTDCHGKLNLIEKSLEGSLYGTTILKIFPGFVSIGYKTGLLIILETPSLKSLAKPLAHNSDITDIDFCKNKNLLLTCSKDMFVKVFKIHDTREDNSSFNLECLFELENPKKFPYCGAGFLDPDATEFLTVISDETLVQIFNGKVDTEELNNEKLFCP